MNTINEKIADLNPDLGRNSSVLAREIACLAIVWVRISSSDNRQKEALLKTVKQQYGVKSARFSREKPMLMVVDYAPEQIRSPSIVKAINGPGVRARLVGC